MLCVVFMKKKVIRMYDSLLAMNHHRQEYLNWIMTFLEETYKNKNSGSMWIDKEQWSTEIILTFPQQENGNDCAVFIIEVADFISDDLPLVFSQTDMPQFRLKIGSSILEYMVWHDEDV